MGAPEASLARSVISRPSIIKWERERFLIVRVGICNMELDLVGIVVGVEG
jgi:hypothetical protein